MPLLDFSRVLADPWATQLLADLGAEVIKIERPGTGDDTRAWGPTFVTGRGPNDLFSAYFLSANRGKKSVAVDFATAEGRDIVTRLGGATFSVSHCSNGGTSVIGSRTIIAQRS